MRYRFKKNRLVLPPASSQSASAWPVEEVRLARLSNGVPQIEGKTFKDVLYGLGFMHAYDRMIQMWLFKYLSQGRLSEFFGKREGVIAIDRYFKRYPFRRLTETERIGLDEEVEEGLSSYCSGVNELVASKYRPLIFRILGIECEPWSLEDMVALCRYMAYSGMASLSGTTKQLITESICGEPERYKAFQSLFPEYFTGYDSQWFSGLYCESEDSDISNVPENPEGSNNWVVSGALCEDKGPIFCNDPHLIVSVLPSIWYEAVLKYDGGYIFGSGIAGGPAIVSGMNEKLSWGITFGAADVEDLFIEKCKDGKYFKDGRWFDFHRRNEYIRPKKGKEVRVEVFENDHGILLADPRKGGRYLAKKWIGFEEGVISSIEGLYTICSIGSVRSAMKEVRSIDTFNLNWVFADREGNIGYKMSGAVPVRGGGLSGILPIPGWDSSYDWTGRVGEEEMPSEFNPSSGYIITANNRLDQDMISSIQTMPLSSDRADRIEELINDLKPLDSEKMKRIQYDVYSPQADRIITFLEPYLRKHKQGRELLKWNREFCPKSRLPSLFDCFYKQLLRETTKDTLFSASKIADIIDSEPFFLINHRRIEEAWIADREPFTGIDWNSTVSKVFEKLEKSRVPKWGKRNRLVMKHLLFGRTPLSILTSARSEKFRGYYSTVHQGSTSHRKGGERVNVGPSYHFIAELTKKMAKSNLPGGARDRPFRRYYKNRLKGWLNGKYSDWTF